MTAQQIAALIPAVYRREILETDSISTAIASTGNPTMMYLATIWKNYINPQESLECGLCMERILNNYRQMQPVFVEMERNASLLESL